MLYLRETNETFSNVYEAKEAILRFSRGYSASKKARATLVFEGGEYILPYPLVFSAKETPELENIYISLVCESGKARFSSLQALDTSKFKNCGDYYTYTFERDENGKFPLLRELYLSGKRLPICKSGFFTHAFAFNEENGRNCPENLEGIYVPEQAAALLSRGELGSAEITLYVEWEFFTLHIEGIDETRENSTKTAQGTCF